MAKYDVTVDTRDMANKIDTVSNKVSGVTTAVVAMETAVIAAERDATNRLCKRLNKGFFSLVTSQIEQKNATALSSVNAYASELMQQQEALLDLKKRMESDFLILTERYSKLFRGLNVALHNRIHELDKPVHPFLRTGRGDHVGAREQSDRFRTGQPDRILGYRSDHCCGTCQAECTDADWENDSIPHYLQAAKHQDAAYQTELFRRQTSSQISAGHPVAETRRKRRDCGNLSATRFGTTYRHVFLHKDARKYGAEDRE